jgi:hypothetical protein
MFRVAVGPEGWDRAPGEEDRQTRGSERLGSATLSAEAAFAPGPSAADG